MKIILLISGVIVDKKVETLINPFADANRSIVDSVAANRALQVGAFLLLQHNKRNE